MADVLALVNENTGVIMLGLLILGAETRIHIRHLIRRVDKLEDKR